MKIGRYYLPIPFVVVLAFILWGMAVGVRLALVESRCLRAGYPKGEVTAGLAGYCIKRVNQTDVVVPLVQAEGRR